MMIPELHDCDYELADGGLCEEPIAGTPRIDGVKHPRCNEHMPRPDK